MIHYTVFADCGGAVYARDNSIEVLLFPKSKDEPDGLSATDLVNELRLAFISSVFFFFLFLIQIQYYMFCLKREAKIKICELELKKNKKRIVSSALCMLFN